MFRFFSLYAYPLFWLFVTIALGVVEASTVSLVAIWFALGAAVSIFVALMGVSFTGQLVVFALVSTISLLVTRPFLRKVIHVRKVRTNADSVIGTLGVVTLDIDNALSQGRVKVNGLDWSARSESGEPIDAGEHVLIKAIEGVKVIVERLA